MTCGRRWGPSDILNLRVNGYDYHISLMHNQAHWTDPQVTAVFNQWAELAPHLQTGANGRIWEDGSKTLESKQAGMMFQGTNQIAANYVSDSKNLADLGFFEYPEINPTYGQDYMDAPMDGFVLPAKAKNVAAAKTVLDHIGTGPAESAYLKYDEWDVGLVSGLQVPTYNQVQKTSVQMISGQKAVSQFGDRDTDPAMAAAAETAIQSFIAQPDHLDHQVDPEQPRGAGEDHLLIVSANQPLGRRRDDVAGPAGTGAGVQDRSEVWSD